MPVRNPFGEPTSKERTTGWCFQYYVREDDWPKPLPAFVSRIVDAGKEPEHRTVKSSDREPFNWLPKFYYFENDFFPVPADLLILENYSQGIVRPFVVLLLFLFLI